MPATYEPIASTTLGTATSDISFTSIPSTYTDLRAVVNLTGASGSANISMVLNSTATTLASYTNLYNAGGSPSSTYNLNQARTILTNGGVGPSTPTMIVIDVLSYSGSTFKTILSTNANNQDTSGVVYNAVSLWRDTAAISSLLISAGAQTMASGTRVTLFGIKAA